MQKSKGCLSVDHVEFSVIEWVAGLIFQELVSGYSPSTCPCLWTYPDDNCSSSLPVRGLTIAQGMSPNPRPCPLTPLCHVVIHPQCIHVRQCILLSLSLCPFVCACPLFLSCPVCHSPIVLCVLLCGGRERERGEGAQNKLSPCSCAPVFALVVSKWFKCSNFFPSFFMLKTIRKGRRCLFPLPRRGSVSTGRKAVQGQAQSQLEA